MKKIFKTIVSKAFNLGLDECNNLGKKIVVKKEINRFLDIGCGDGKLTMEFAKIIKPKEIHGIEFVDEWRQQAESRGIKCTKCDLNNGWAYDDDFFDIILSSQNIEHMHNTRLYLEECHRCLRPGGQLIVLTENLSSWPNIGSLFLGWQPFSMISIDNWNIGNPLTLHSDGPEKNKFNDFLDKLGKYKENNIRSGLTGHVRVLSFIGLKHIIKKIGFENVRIYSRGYPPIWGKLSNLFCCIDRRHGHFLIATGFKEENYKKY